MSLFFFWRLVVCVSRMCGTASPSAGKQPGCGISRWAGKSVNLQPYLGRSPSVSSEVDILLSSETWHFCAPRFASRQNFLRAVWTLLSHNSYKEKSLGTRKKPGKDLSALLFLLCTVRVERFSCSNLTDVAGCVLPNPEVCVSGNRAQLLTAAQRPLLSTATNAGLAHQTKFITHPHVFYCLFRKMRASTTDEHFIKGDQQWGLWILRYTIHPVFFSFQGWKKS